MAQPVALGVIGLVASPFLLKKSHKAAISVVGLSVVVACSLVFSLTPFSDGVLFNAFILSSVGLVSWLRAKKSPAGESDA